MHKFQVGDVVTLKTGGPAMTIRDTPHDARTAIICQWFEGDELKNWAFPKEMLVKVEESKRVVNHDR